MGDPYLPAHRHGVSRPLVTGVVGFQVLVLIALIVGGLEVRRQHSQLGRVRGVTASLQAADKAQASATATQLTGARSQLAALAAELTSAQNRLRADEAQLKITAAQLPPDVVKLAAAVSPSVVLIGCGDDIGTGFALDLPATAGFQTAVVTAEHVVDACAGAGGAAVSVTHDGVSLPARLRAADPSSDVAVIDVKGVIAPLQPAPAAPASGQFVLAVGNPLGITDNVTQGNVSQVDTTYFLNTAPISNGNSGGPLVDSAGRVLGIADAAETANSDQPVVENLNYALRLNSLCASILSGSACATLH